MGIFSRCHITLELDSRVSFKKKAALKKNIIDNDGIVSFIVTKKTTHLVVNNADKSAESYKGRMAQKYGIPIVSTSFVDVSVERGKLVEPDDYLAVGKTAAEQFQTGKIIASQQDKKNLDNRKKRQKSTVSLNQLKSLPWPHSTGSSVDFNEDQYEVARYVFLKRFDGRSQLTTFASLEIHVVMDQSSSHYRIFLHHGTLEKKNKSGDIGSKCCYYLSTVLDTEHVFTLLYKQFISSPHKMTKVTFLSSHVGSDKLKKMMLDIRSSIGASDVIPADISDLVGYIWNEANGELNNVLSVPVEGIKLEQVEKAEAALLSIKLFLDGTSKDGDVQKLTDEFYFAIPHKLKTALDNKRAIAEKQDLCQLVRDVVSVGESTNWSTRSSVVSKYRSLRCDITVLDHCSDEYAQMKQLIINRQDNSGELIEVKNIYGVHRPVEDGNFADQLSNKQLLFHSSPVKNFVGILSRGLLMPKIVVDDFGGTRTDPGMLGSGIYFASSSSVSSLYSRPGKTCGSRLMLVNQVALGNCMETASKMMELSEAPTGYNSVHGVKSSVEVSSHFKGDEYAIYSTSQQRIRYLIEFSLPGDGSHDQGSAGNLQLPVTGEESVSEASDVDESADAETVSLNDVKDIEDPLNKVEAGLVGGDIPLQSVHIKAKLIDLAAQVVVLQAYKNFSKKPIEAKYVFPLDDMAAVCGFEAFINGKHIVGEVKEKEQAHKEYREAISQGHGAYLMDEETPDVFTVSVGNLPAGASVLIKITYVAELLVEGENIVFSLPGSVAPWKKDAALDITTQTDVDKIKVTKQGDVSVQVAVEMPFKIRTIESPTHKLRIKKTATKAVIEMCEGGEGLGDGFQLLIGLAEIHVPRMWVEENDQSHHACMLTFYPEFEADCIVDNEIILCLDCSNSMKGDTLVSAKKVLLLILHHLPPKCLFNVITFGAAYDELFSSSQPKSKETVTAATNYIQEATATMGSTDVWRPLRSLLLLSSGTTATVDSSTLPPRNVFLVTDGHMTEEQPTLQAIRQAVHTTRLFTFGVGKTANRHFLKSMARVGAGYEEFFDPKTKSKWQRKVKSQLSKAFEPALTSVEVLWQLFDDNAPKPIQAPQEIVSLFSGSRQVIYGFVPHCLQATLKAKIGRKTVETMVSTSEMGVTRGKVLHQLTARAIIRDWTDGSLDADRTQHEIIKRDRKSYIINISKEYSIVSQFTSFVAIEKREKDETFDQSKGPSIAELVDKENVDMLQYMSWEIDQSKDLVKIYETSSLTFTKNLTYDFESLDTKSKLQDALHQITVEACQRLPAELSESLSNKITSKLESDDFNYEEAQVFYLKVKGDYYRYLTQNVKEERKEAIMCEAHETYKLASELASKILPSTHPTRLAVALNFSIFYNEIMKEPEKACDLAKEAFDDAIAQLDSLNEASYKDSTLLMQLLRDNLVLMQDDDGMSSKDSLSLEGKDEGEFNFCFDDIICDMSSYDNVAIGQGEADSEADSDIIAGIGFAELDQFESEVKDEVSNSFDDELPEDLFTLVTCDHEMIRSCTTINGGAWKTKIMAMLHDEDVEANRDKLSPTLEDNEKMNDNFHDYETIDEFRRDDSRSFTKAPLSLPPIFPRNVVQGDDGEADSDIIACAGKYAEPDQFERDDSRSFTKAPLSLPPIFPRNEELRRKSASARRPLPSTPLQKAITGKRVAGPVDRGTKPLAVSSVVQESERTIYPQLKIPTALSISDESENQSMNMPVVAASASVLAPSISDDDVYSFDHLLPVQDAAHFQQQIAITKSKPPSQPSDGWEDHIEPVDKDGLKITTESYVHDQLASVKINRTYERPQDASQQPIPLCKQRRHVMERVIPTAVYCYGPANRTSYMDSRLEVPPPIPPKRKRRPRLSFDDEPPPLLPPKIGSTTFDDVPPPLPVKRDVTRTSTLIAKNEAAIPLRNAVADGRPPVSYSDLYQSSDQFALGLEDGDLGEDFYQEEDEELEYIPNETTVVQLFVIQEAKTFSWKLSDLGLVNLDDVKLLQLLEDTGAKSLGVVVCQLLYSLVATEIIIFYLKKFLNSTAVTPDNKIFDHNKFNKALEFSKLTNGRHPSLYKRLELGNSWEDAITKLIAICHV